jgi:serine/threonine protein kinase
MNAENASPIRLATCPPGQTAIGELASLGEYALGSTILERFKVFGIRRGGVGLVYLVSDVISGDKFALKTYQKTVSPEVQKSFFDEVEAWISLPPHPNIVRAYSLLSVADVPYLKLEFMSGGSLRERMGGKMELTQAIRLAYQICRGLAFAGRSQQFGHFDLKPENILFDSNGTLKITDFGLSGTIRIINGRYPRVLSGSWPYAPPERFAEKPEDCRSDIYSFGVLFYELITRKLPFPFDPRENLAESHRRMALFHEPGKTGESSGIDLVCTDIYYKGIPGLEKRDVSIILSTCLQRHPARRYANFADLCRVMEEAFQLERPADSLAGDDDSMGIEQARAFALSGKTDKALDRLNSLLARNPSNARLWLETAFVLISSGQGRDAEDFIQRAIDLDPSCEAIVAKMINSAERKDSNE